jgi:hypothetical protein
MEKALSIKAMEDVGSSNEFVALATGFAQLVQPEPLSRR